MQLLDEIAKAVDERDETKAITLVNEALKKGVNPVDVLQQGVVAGLKSVGHKFETKEYYMIELMEAGDLGKKVIDIINPHLPSTAGGKAAKVVIGATKGDAHDIGKNLVSMQLRISGFEIYDLGVDVPSISFIDKAEEVGADIIALSAFLTPTMAYFSEVTKYLKDMGLRNKYIVVVGGGATDAAFAKSVGADGTAPDAIQAVKLCQGLMSEKKKKE